ncbi:tape measure protein [Lactobacillus rhamnosus]|uniref:Tape measure protein n=1 Tax=Lacticaseibacillus rhamnosus TaxID=47715 RepID=A0A7Y7QGZ4_LACRH|nr:tape measure protein [Lacticaseibacillus rhamnosus]NVO88954.1 tape measure protein [Lacticaseibacillus rhamnosus]
MAGKIPVGEMNTRISLDGVQATETLRQMKADVSALTSQWKVQQAELRSAGDAVGAAQAKYDGLSSAISKQRDYIERLKSEQSGLDRTTNDGAASYAKLEGQISSASSKLLSLSSQQDRAKESLDYYKSGLASAQSELSKISSVSRSYVDRLQAEGKQTEANKAQLSGLSQQYNKMAEIYKIQASELNKIESESGKASDAYAKQSVRVNETAASMAKAKTQMTELNDSINKANPSVFDRLKSHIVDVNKQTEKGSGLIRKFVAGGLITNAITSGWQHLSSGITETVKSGLELNEAGEKINETWSNMGKSANDIQILSSQMSYLRSETGATGGEINKMQTTVDTMTHGVTEKTTVISAGIASVATASHIGGEGMDSLSKSMTRVIASGTLTSTNLARLEKQAPTLGAQLAKAAGVSQDSFAKMVADGKIKSDDFMNLVYKIGTTSKTTFDEFGKTSEGAVAQMSGAWTTLKAKMTAPLFDVKNSGMQSLASILTSTVVQNAAADLGLGLAHIANYAKQILDYVSEHKADVTGIAGDMWDIAKIAGGTVWDTFKSIIGGIGNMLGVGGKNAEAMKDPLGTIHEILDKIVENRSGIETTVKTILALFAVKKALDFAVGVSRVYSALKNLETINLGSLTSGFGKLTGSKLPSVGGASLDTAAEGAGAVASTGSKIVGAVGKVAGIGTAIDVGGSIVSSLLSNNTQEKIKAASKTTGSLIGGGIGAAVGSIIPGVGTAAGAGIGAGIGNFLGSSKIVQSWAKSIHSSMAKASAGLTVKSPKISLDSKELGDQFAKFTKTLSKKFVVSMSTDSKSLAKAQASVQKTYTSMQKSVEAYYKKKEANAAADFKKLVANGTMTQAQADKQLAKLKKNDAAEAKSKTATYAAMEKNANSYYAQAQKIANGNTTKLLQIAQKYGKNSSKYQTEQNKELLAAYKKYGSEYASEVLRNNAKVNATLSKGAKQQESLLSQLNKRKGTLNMQQLDNTAKTAKKEYDAAVKPAQQARDDIIKAANERYKETVNTAKREYKDNGSISKSQYNEIVKNARAQRDDSADAANSQYKQVTKHMTNQYKSTTSAISKQKAEVSASSYEETAAVSGYANDQSYAVVNHMRNQANSSLDAAHKQASGTNKIFSTLGSWWNDIVHFFGGSKMPTGGANYDYSKVQPLAYARGGATKNGTALVGEAGPELRYQPYADKVDILGAHGAEFARVNSGDYILNAADTAKLMSGQFHGTLPGYAGGTSSLDDFINGIKNTASKIWDKVSKSVEGILSKVSNPLKFFTDLADKTFNVNSVPGVGSMAPKLSGEMRKEDIKGVADFFDRIKKMVTDMENIGNGPMKSLPELEAVARQAAKIMKVNPSDHFIEALANVAMSESGGRASAANNTDSNAKAGLASVGLLQYIPTTWSYYAMPGYNNRSSVLDNFVTFFNNSDWADSIGYVTYPSWGGHYKWDWKHNGPTGHRRFEDGGFANVASIFAENGPEAAIPLSSIKSSRGYEMLGKTAAAMAARDNLGQSVNESERVNDLEDKLNKLTDGVSAMVDLLKVVAAKDPSLNVTKYERYGSAERQRRLDIAARGGALGARL